MQDWQLLNTAHGQRGDGGRKLALTDLVSDKEDLSYTDLSNARLDNFDFRSAHLDGSIFDNANIQSARFDCIPKFGIKKVDIIGFPDCAHVTTLDRAEFNNVVYITSVRRTEDLGTEKSGKYVEHRPDFTAAELKDAIFTQPKSMAADATIYDQIDGIFNAADFQSATFKDASIGADARFAYASFIGTTFYNISSSGTLYKHASFIGAKIDHANFDHVNFSGAYFVGTIFSDTEFHNVNLEDASFSSETKIDGHVASADDFLDSHLCHTRFDEIEVNRDCLAKPNTKK